MCGCCVIKSSDIKNSVNSKERYSATKQRRKLSPEIRANYKLSKVIGNGNFGKVLLAENRRTSQKCAIKAIRTSKMEANNLSIKEEVRIIQTLDHANIIKYYENYSDNEFFYVVMEYCGGGDLFDKIIEKEVFSESEARTICYKLLSAIAHCHANGIAHRDLKPENILLPANIDSAASKDLLSCEVKIIDFGLSKIVSPSQINGFARDLNSVVGTPYYVAPEVFDGFYTPACDLWSIGVIAYVLLSGYLPFGGNSAAEIISRVRKNKPSYSQENWEKVSPEGLDLVQRLLEGDSNRRPSAVEALRHPWFSKEEDSLRFNNLVDGDILGALREYRGTTKLQMEAMNVLVKTLDDTQIENLRECFRKIDRDNSGYIDYQELKNAAYELGIQMTADEISSIIERVDYYGNGKINYSEFLAGTISTKEFLTEERLWSLFKHFDIDNSNHITPANIRMVLAKSGRTLSTMELDKILTLYDTEKKGKLSFREFTLMMSTVKFNPQEEDIMRISQSQN
jgi:calcium-dependent protein kinase